MSVKILTVDDSKTIRLIVGKAFKPFDCTVLEADNGVEGLAMASREKPDVILLDYTMPVMDGYEVLTRLRSDPDLKPTPVIMLTAEAGRETVVKIAKLGVRDYLIKPFKGELIVERVNRVVPLSARAEKPQAPKRFDDPIKVLVVDDKPVIVAQIRTALADTPWQISSADSPAAALEACKQGVDIVVASLSLPADGAFNFLKSLRSAPGGTATPVLGLCVKTAVADQTRAQQAGFGGCLTKPIDAEELKSKVTRVLRLEISYRYFQQREGWLAMTLPKDVSTDVVQDISRALDEQLVATVDAGGDKLIVDMTKLEAATLPAIELVISAFDAAAKLSLKHAVACTNEIITQCKGYEETQTWVFAGSPEEALKAV
jgi:two-component system cell cycle response regulator